MSIQVLHTADNHLDITAKNYGPTEMARKKDFSDSFDQVVNVAIKDRPDLMLISGDLYHRINPRNPPRTTLMEKFRKIKSHGTEVFMISGHHDTPKSMEDGISPLAVFESAGFVTTFLNSNEVSHKNVRLNGIDVCISGTSYNFFLPQSADPIKNKKIPSEGEINILMLHYSIEGFEGYPFQNEPLVRLSSIPDKVAYVAAGHLHTFQHKRVGRTTICYPGSTEFVTLAEHGEKGFVWTELSRDGVEDLKFIPLKTRAIKRVKVAIEEKEDITELLKKVVDEYENRETILRLELHGTMNSESLKTYRKNEVVRYAVMEGKVFYLFIDDSEVEFSLPKPLPPVKISSPLDEFRQYVNTLIEQIKDEGEKKLLEEVKKLGLRVLEEEGAW
ncbi:MAG: exonuclease SbcCD subunit D [Candidatus Bathyarchaeia archaeon]